MFVEKDLTSLGLHTRLASELKGCCSWGYSTRFKETLTRAAESTKYDR